MIFVLNAMQKSRLSVCKEQMRLPKPERARLQLKGTGTDDCRHCVGGGVDAVCHLRESLQGGLKISYYKKSQHLLQERQPLHS